MGRNRIVTPTTVRIPLSDGDWIDVKRELNAGEERRVFGRMVKEMRVGEQPELDPEQVGLTKLVEYLVAWSFTDARGKPIDLGEDNPDLREAALKSIDTDSYTEVSTAILAHETRVEAEKAARKNDQAMSMASAAT
jgi:hypothetical protein